jgi:hypothetical protein
MHAQRERLHLPRFVQIMLVHAHNSQPTRIYYEQ